MTDSEMTDLLLCKPKFMEKGPDMQTRMQMSVNFAEPPQNKRASLTKMQNYEMQEYFCNLDSLEGLLKTNFTAGLTDEQVQERLNEKVRLQDNQESNLRIFLKELNIFAIFLVIANIISIALAVYGSGKKLEFAEEEITTSVILFIVLLLTFIMGYQQRKKSKSALKKESSTTVTVIRNCKQSQIEVAQLVYGDIIELGQGLLVEADMRVLESRDLQVQINEDSNNIVQATKGSQLFSGSIIRSGAGSGVVIKTGANTTIAQIQKRKGGKNLQNQLIWFQQILSGITLFVIISVLVWDLEKWSANAAYGFRAIEQVIIAMIPQGLLVVVTISFQMAMRRMAKKSLLVQNAEAIERLSDVNCLCIGLNEVLTSKIYTFNSLFDGSQLQYDLKLDQIRQLFKCCILTCDSKWMDGTEKALFDYFKQFDDTIALLNQTRYYTNKNGVQYHIPFNSSRRYSISITVEDDKYVVYIKGAPEVIWNCCNQTRTQFIDAATTQEFNNSLLYQSKKGLRAVGFAYLEIDKESDLRINEYGYDFTLQNFIYLGTVYLNVSIDEQSKLLLQRIYKKAIKLVIITGEHPETAKRICQNSGCFDNPTIVEGTQLYLHYDDQDITTRLSSVESKIITWCQQPEIVFARTCPDQKISVVKALQQLNYKVAVTGEGLTDIGSFKQAEVSVSKRYGSQQMIINQSDLVLTSHRSNFLEVYLAIMESRRAINNVIKSMMFCLSSNTAMTAALFLYLYLGTPLLLSQNLMLLITITVDLILGIALAREEIEMQIPKRFNLVFYAIFVIGIIEAAGGVLTALTTMRYFGFEFQTILLTRFENVSLAPTISVTIPISEQEDIVYNPNYPNLNNPYLQIPCYNNTSLNMTQYQWISKNLTDFRQQFVQCLTCTAEQNATSPTSNGNCWVFPWEDTACLAPVENFTTSDEMNTLGNYCYTNRASFFASNSFFIFLVLAQCANYFVLRSQIQPFYNQKVNSLALYGMTISILLLPFVTYVPGIQSVFETKSLPWSLFGVAGFPFIFLIVGVAEAHKFMLRKQLNM